MTNHAPQLGLVLDCADPDTLARFWSEALGYDNLGTAGAYVALYPRGGERPKLLLQRVAEAKVVKNRMHLDIVVGDIERESARLEGLGAKRVEAGVCREDGST